VTNNINKLLLAVSITSTATTFKKTLKKNSSTTSITSNQGISCSSKEHMLERVYMLTLKHVTLKLLTMVDTRSFTVGTQSVKTRVGTGSISLISSRLEEIKEDIFMMLIKGGSMILGIWIEIDGRRECHRRLRRRREHRSQDMRSAS